MNGTSLWIVTPCVFKAIRRRSDGETLPHESSKSAPDAPRLRARPRAAKCDANLSAAKPGSDAAGNPARPFDELSVPRRPWSDRLQASQTTRAVMALAVTSRLGSTGIGAHTENTIVFRRRLQTEARLMMRFFKL
jgi:hypothetical protein